MRRLVEHSTRVDQMILQINHEQFEPTHDFSGSQSIYAQKFTSEQSYFIKIGKCPYI